MFNNFYYSEDFIVQCRNVNVMEFQERTMVF